MRKRRMKNALIALLLITSTTMLNAQNDARLLRQPDINNDMVVFVYAGDIWSVNADGGDAKRLTSHMGFELFPKISPDGQWIAFSAEYSGNRQVYVMPATGGKAKQLTWYNDVGVMPPRGGFDNVVLDWTPDSKKIMVRSNRTPFGERNGKFFLVSIDGGYEEALQITEGGFGVLSPDANKVCYAPISREFRSWKRYKGGRASDLWIYDLQNDVAEQITDFVGTDQIPTWFGDKIYYASDEDLTLNIHSYDVNTKERKQITTHSDFDVMWPSGENGWLAYENGGYLYKLNLETGQSEKLTVNINFDNPNLIPYYKNVRDDIHSIAVSPSGKRALFDARGDIFSVPAEHGEIINLTNTQGVREIFPNWSPDAKYISYISDKSGEYEIYVLENKKGARPRQVTKNSTSWKYNTVWSPDSKYLLYSDRNQKLHYVDVATGIVKTIASAHHNEIRSYNFSPDSKWVTYANSGENGQGAIWVYNITAGQNTKLTDDTFEDMTPTFSHCGNYIYFLSNRNFNLSFSSFEFDYLYDNATRIYAIMLTHDSPKLFKDKEDIETIKEDKPAEEKKSKKGKKDTDKPAKEDKSVKIDFDGINNRIVAFPMRSGRYFNLRAVDGGFIYASNDGLHIYKLEKEESESMMPGAYRALVSANGKSMLYRSNGDYGITSIAPGKKAGTGKLDLDDLEMKIDPRKEWNQIYTDAWRIFRDYFYAENLHNVDWEGLKERYGKILPYVGHRADLDYILHELVSESNTGHAYANYGDFKRVDRRETGLLGADLVANKAANRYKIAKIYKGENWNPSRRSPLTEHGINVKEGDYLISINGNNITLADNPYLFLENTIDKKIDITVNSTASASGAKTYKIKPIASELELFYLDWVESRRALVEKLSGGKIGYIHVPNTAVEGNRELHRGMYAYHNKEALIIDDRYNGGGFIPDQMAALLDRDVLSYWHKKGLWDDKTPGVAHDGPKAMLINGYSSSGGDAFPYYFRKKGLGKLIGSRTWGGLVGISGNAELVDGGYIAVPRFGIFDENEEWIIEGIGVYPDIEVYDAPDKVAKGIDPSIEAAIKHLLKELETKPVKKVNTPAMPDRSGWIEKDIK